MKRETHLSKIEIYHLLTGRTPMLLNRFFSIKLKEAGIPLSKEQWSLLSILWIKDGCSQQYLADQTYRDKPSTTRLLDTLEREGYIIRNEDQQDKRSKLISLTPKAIAMEKKVNEVIDETLTLALGEFAESEVVIVKHAFDKVFNNINKLI